MLNFFYIIDLVHHSENSKLLSLYQNNESFFENSDSLFSKLPENHLKDISPILCKVPVHEEEIVKSYLDNKPESILFIASAFTLTQLSTHLQKHMEFKLADGRTGIIRLYDPRTFNNFNSMLKPQQKHEFWKNIEYIRGWNDINNNYYTEENITNV